MSNVDKIVDAINDEGNYTMLRVGEFFQVEGRGFVILKTTEGYELEKVYGDISNKNPHNKKGELK